MSEIHHGRLVLWHGGRSWQGPAEVRPGRSKDRQHGPGIYLTTSAATARHYARGGGVVLCIELAPPIRWLEGVKVAVSDMKGWVTREPNLRRRRELFSDLDRAAARQGDPLPAVVIVNLAVNHEVLTGPHGPSLAAWLVEHGVDADVFRPPLFTGSGTGDEDWVVLFNAAKILSVRRAAPEEQRDLPRVAAQDRSAEERPYWAMTLAEYLAATRAKTTYFEDLPAAEQQRLLKARDEAVARVARRRYPFTATLHGRQVTVLRFDTTYKFVEVEDEHGEKLTVYGAVGLEVNGTPLVPPMPLPDPRKRWRPQGVSASETGTLFELQAYEEILRAAIARGEPVPPHVRAWLETS